MKYISRLNFSLLIGIVSVIVYFITVTPNVTFTDSGELAGACVSLGVCHPTGYPLFTILGYLWTLLPLPFSKILMLNLFAGVATALSSVIFFNIVFEIINYFDITNKHVPIKPEQPKIHSKDKHIKKKIKFSLDLGRNNILWISLISGFIYCFARTVWDQATAIEVYSLQLLLDNLVIFFLIKAVKENTSKNKYYLLTAFIAGLGFSNHMTTILLIPAILFLYFKNPGERFNFSKEKFKYLALLILPFLLGLTFYIYLPLRSSELPEFNWGWVHRSFDKFLYHVQGKQYQVWMFSGTDTIATNINKFLNVLPFEFGIIGLIPLLFGFYTTYRWSKEIFWFLIIMIISCLTYSLNYSIHDIETYFLVAFIALFIFTSSGLVGLIKYKLKLIPIIVLIPIVSFISNYSANDQSNDNLVPEYTKILVNNLQPNAIILSTQWDYWVSAFWYMQKIENYRPDVVLIDKELLRRTWYIEQLKRWYPETMKLSEKEIKNYLVQLNLFEEGGDYDPYQIQKYYVELLNSFVDYNFGKRPVYLTLDIMQSESDVAVNYEKIPEGFAFRLEKLKKIYPESLSNINVNKFIHSLKGQEGHLVEGIALSAAINLSNIGRYCIYTHQKSVAIDAFKMALRIDPKNSSALGGMQEVMNMKDLPEVIKDTLK